ncbi:MAG: SBBP repeat-containing protein, partial [Hydrogenophilales bacterium]|nr:SBBP repeat-containing protein [Hydrogenophilales bacterium]
MTPNMGSAAGSVQLNGTFSSVSFRIEAAPNSNEGAGGDGIEMALTFDVDNDTPSLTWNTFAGGAGSDYIEDTVVDASGNVYVAGHGSATWGSPVRAFSTGEDAFVAKFDSSGNLLWHTFLGGAGNWDYANGIALDGSGNVYVAGESNATWGAPVRAYTGGTDAFVAKLNATTGALTWHSFMGNASSDWSYGIDVDASGNVYVGGASLGTWGTPVRAFTVAAG